MITNTVLTRRVRELDDINRIASNLRTLGFETKVSMTTENVILATDARPRTLRRAREMNPNNVGGIPAFMAMMAGV